jgi:hypothetical protein
MALFSMAVAGSQSSVLTRFVTEGFGTRLRSFGMSARRRWRIVAALCDDGPPWRRQDGVVSTRRPPRMSIATPTGRPPACPSVSRKPVRTSTGSPSQSTWQPPLISHAAAAIFRARSHPCVYVRRSLLGDRSSRSPLTNRARWRCGSHHCPAGHHCRDPGQRHGQPEPGVDKGDHLVYITGSGDTVNLSAGNDTITDTYGNNTYILPAAGNGTDTFSSDILTTGDTLDPKTARAATHWNG